MKKYGYLLIILTSITSIATAQAQALFFMNADFGGDTLVTVPYTDGSKANVDAGAGVTLGGGMNWLLSDSLILQTTAAWKFQTIPEATNGDLTWTRFPVEAIALYNAEKIRMGAGLTYHLMNKLSATGAISSEARDYDNTLGYVFSFEYLSSPRLSFTARYTVIDYTETGTSNSADGNSLGIGVNFYFDN